MKLILTAMALLLMTAASAQQCNNHLLMKEGTEMEYLITQTYGKTLYATRLQYTVLSVDSDSAAGATKSKILKKGISSNNDNHFCRREITLECDGKNIGLPFDFIFTDTIFMSDLYKRVKRRHAYWANLPNNGPATYIIPLDLVNTKQMPEGAREVELKYNRYNIEEMDRVGFSHEPRGVVQSRKKGEFKHKIKEIRIAGTQKISTGAGSFNCYKIIVQFVEPAPVMMTMYINEQVGLVRYTLPGARGGGTEGELVRLRK